MADVFENSKFEYLLEIMKDGNTERKGEKGFASREEATEAMNAFITECQNNGYKVLHNVVSQYFY